MIQKLKNKLAILASVLLFAAPLAVPVAVHAAPYTTNDLQSSLCSGTQLEVSSTGGNLSSCKKQNASSFNATLQTIVNIFSGVVGVIAVIMIIVGGLRYITSGGDSNKVSAAKNTLIYAIIGLVIVALSQLIVHFVINQASTV